MGVELRLGVIAPGLRVLAFAFASAALALVALPTGAAADTCVPPSRCPPEILSGIERAPGGVIFTGSVTHVATATGRVRLAVLDWYHRDRIPGLEPAAHPATMEVLLGPRLLLAGQAIPAAMPHIGSRFLVVGTWRGAPRGASVAHGVFANLNYEEGAAWLAETKARFAAFPPTPAEPPPAVPLDAPWVILGATIVGLLLAAVVLESIADARDPLPAS